MTIIVLQDTPDHTCTKDTVTGIETWTWKPGTPGANQKIIADKAASALTNNQAFLALPSPTQPQALAQVQSLTRQVNALIREALYLYNDTSDT